MNNFRDGDSARKENRHHIFFAEATQGLHRSSWNWNISPDNKTNITMQWGKRRRQQNNLFGETMYTNTQQFRNFLAVNKLLLEASSFGQFHSKTNQRFLFICTVLINRNCWFVWYYIMERIYLGHRDWRCSSVSLGFRVSVWGCANLYVFVYDVCHWVYLPMSVQQ